MKQQFTEIIFSDFNKHWEIFTCDDCMFGFSIYDDFDMKTFLEYIAKVNMKYTFFYDYYAAENLSNNLDLTILNRKIYKDKRKSKLKIINNIKI